MRSLRGHWAEYGIEAACLGMFMVSACLFTCLLGHPDSPVQQAIHSEVLRRALMGVAMGTTAVAIIYSPWGMRSGAHMNPAVTLAFWRLGKVRSVDAGFYMAAQAAGGVLGVMAVHLVLGPRLSHPAVRYAATVPGPFGAGPAFGAEVVISFILMSVILAVTNIPRVARYVGVCAALLVATWITFESPLSGMSMNPARSLSSALPAGIWTSFWIYAVAPPLGMLVAAEVHRRFLPRRGVLCAKLHHDNSQPCIFKDCRYPARSRETVGGRVQGTRLEMSA